MKMKRILQLMALLLLVTLPVSVYASASTRRHKAHGARISGHVQESPRARRHMASLQHSRRVATTSVAVSTRLVRGRNGRLRRVTVRGRRHYAEQFTASSFTNSDITAGDITTGEDPIVRQAAIEALGNMYGTAVAIDPKTGRVLAMVNQKLALSSGAEPCSTIKISVALAALEEGIITKDTPVNLGGHYSMDLTYALAHSVNPYFETLGRRLGFERVRHYANEFGLGELAGYNIPNEQLGSYPDQELPQSRGGVGRMCSFGEGVSMTRCSWARWSRPSPTAAPSTICSIHLAAGDRQLPAAHQAHTRHREDHPRDPAGHGRRGRLGYSAAAACQLQPIPGDGQDRHLLEQRNPLRLVRQLCGHPVRAHRDGLLP